MLEKAAARRESLFDDGHETALRLFNGFSEGAPCLVVDIYARTAVLHNYANPPEKGLDAIAAADDATRKLLPWIRTVILKTRNSPLEEERRGRIIHGGPAPDRAITENNVRYAVDLLMNRDASFYMDTRNLREWASKNLRGKTVLNTFAYTGSLGVAAMAGGTARVVQMDQNKNFLNMAKRSCELNKLPFAKKDFIVGDFWERTSWFKKSGELFDCVILDPPFFASGRKGVVDLENNSARMINKVRPLVADGGRLVAINNALYVSGAEYMRTLEGLADDRYLKIAGTIPVPEDFAGPSDGGFAGQITDPAPFNHSTKIAILEVRRKKP